jgi:hypothetical protein
MQRHLGSHAEVALEVYRRTATSAEKEVADRSKTALLSLGLRTSSDEIAAQAIAAFREACGDEITVMLEFVGGEFGIRTDQCPAPGRSESKNFRKLAKVLRGSRKSRKRRRPTPSRKKLDRHVERLAPPVPRLADLIDGQGDLAPLAEEFL